LLWLRVDELFSELKRWPRVQLKTENLADKTANVNLGYRTLPDLAVQAQQNRRWIICANSSNPLPVRSVFVESEGRREALGELLTHQSGAEAHYPAG
jgi:transcription-repair coupling factor (superfamily II helicase)